jgi:hypothetical protein
MILKNVFAAIVATTLLASGGSSLAADYQPGDFLHLDLSKAVLSPKRLGPATQFAPLPIEASSDPAKPAIKPTAEARAEPKITPEPSARKVRTARVHLENAQRAHVEKRRGAARTKLAHRHTNPLDAQAFDRRIQVWPCKTGGICDWHR